MPAGRYDALRRSFIGEVVFVAMEATYDPEADAAYVYMNSAKPPSDRTEVAEDGTIMDVNQAGQVLGYELLSVTLRGLDDFPTVPREARALVEKAMEIAKRTGSFTRISDEAG